MDPTVPTSARPEGPPTYVVNRADDHLVLAVTFLGFTETRVAGGRATMVANDDLSYLYVVFAPQAFYEQRLIEDNPLPVGALVAMDLASPSALAVATPGGTVVPMTNEGILAAILGFPVFASARRQQFFTAVDMPAGLVGAPVPAIPGEAVTLHHPVAVRDSGGTVALWQTEARAPSGLQFLPQAAWGYALPTGSLPAAETSDGPLFYGQRTAILSSVTDSVQADKPVLPTADRMRLSALGGTLTAHGTWTHGPKDPVDPGSTVTWQHDLALGRDRRVQYTQRGVLLPFGHAAVLVEVAERSVETEGSGGVSLMRVHTTVLVEPIRDYVAGAPGIRYAFPFDRAEVLTTTITGLTPVDQTGVLMRGNDEVKVPVRLFGGQGPVDVAVSMTFVGSRPAGGLDTQTPSTPPGHGGGTTPPGDLPHADPSDPVDFQPMATTRPIPVPASPVDLVRAATPSASDVHIVHRITLQTLQNTAADVGDPARYVPTISSIRVELPAVRTLLPPGTPSIVDAALSDELTAAGAQAKTVLQDLTVADAPPGTDAALVLNFANDPRRSGALVSPSLVADTVSRDLGPTAKSLLDAALDSPITDSMKGLFGQAKLLGMSLQSPLPATMAGLPVPQVLQVARTAQDIAAGKPPPVTLTWKGLKPVGRNSFLTGANGRDTTLDLTATVSADDSVVNCVLSDFALSIPDKDTPLLQVIFTSLTFHAEQGRPPSLKAAGVKAHFDGDLDFIAMLEQAVDFGDAGQLVTVDADGITASYSLSVPEVSAGVVCLRNVDFGASAVVPFTPDVPVSVAMHFATRDNPFTAAVLAFGGGGYVDLLVDSSGMRRFEGSLDFGAQIAVNFVIAAGEVHAFGGVRFLVSITGSATDIHATAFLRFGGSLQVLGLVTVSIELSLELTYADDGDHSTLTGRATLVIDVDVTIWSDSVELDSGEWVIAGGRGADAVAALDASDDQLAGWRAYRAAFAS